MYRCTYCVPCKSFYVEKSSLGDDIVKNGISYFSSLMKTMTT